MTETLTSRIKDLVAKSGTVNSQAKAIGLKQQTLQRIVTGAHKNPAVDTLSKIAGYYNTTVDWLYSGNGEGPKSGIPGTFNEQFQWEEITREIAGNDQALFKLIFELPTSFLLAVTLATQSFAGGQQWDNLPPIIAALRADRAAWCPGYAA